MSDQSTVRATDPNNLVRGSDVENYDAMDVCICWPFTGQRQLASGTRIDLECPKCHVRVCADKHTQRFVDGGARIVCMPCAIADGLLGDDNQ